MQDKVKFQQVVFGFTVIQLVNFIVKLLSLLRWDKRGYVFIADVGERKTADSSPGIIGIGYTKIGVKKKNYLPLIHMTNI